MNNPIPLSDVKFVYELVHSKMFYSGLNFDEAFKAVEATFDGTQPIGLFEVVQAYHIQRTSS